MLRSYVCRQCRLHLSRRLASPPNPQWQPKATFISLRSAPPRPDADAQHASEEAVDESGAAQQQQQQEQQEEPRFRMRRPEHLGRAPAGRYSRSAHRADPAAYHRRGQHRDDVEQHNQGYEQADGEEGRSAVRPPPATTKPYAQSMSRYLKDGKVRAAWDVFEQNYTSRDTPALIDPAYEDLALINGREVFSTLSAAIATEFCNGNPNIPTPTTVLFRYAQLDIADQKIWRKAIRYLTDQLLWSMSGATHPIPKKRDTESIMSELLSVWRLLFQRYGTKHDPLESISSEWKSIPDVQSLTKNLETRYFGLRLQDYHPGIATGSDLQFSAITIFNYFHGTNHAAHTIPESLQQQNAPFLQLLTYTLASSNVTPALGHTDIATDFLHLPKDFRKSVLDQVTAAPLQAMKLRGLDPSASAEQQANDLQELYLKRIARRVLEQASVSGLDNIWAEVQFAYTTPEKQTQVPPLIYNAFLSSYMTLHQPDRTVKVWNHMIAHGVKPDLRTWVAMLDGCAKARDRVGLDAVWDRMHRAGVEPDNYAWTTRIHALVTNREINKAFAALDDMGKRWLSAENTINSPPARGKGAKKLPSNAKVVNTFTKPSVEVVNGAISAFVQLNPITRRRGLRFEEQVQSVHKILQWAGNFDIKPDARTYNILIQLYLRGNDYPMTFKLLRQMAKEGIEGDLATHSMLLRAAFDNQKFNDLSHSEQAERMLTLFTELESGGLKLNKYIYQGAIDRLLKLYGNISAVRVVVDHMLDRGLVVSPQIYTSLITHYFAQGPPDISAVDSLVRQIFGPPVAPTDSFLFDRIVEGYAVNGEVAAMMTVLTRMGKHGKRPSYRSLTKVITALTENEEWERARHIVKDVLSGEGVAQGGPIGGSPGRNHFLFIAQKIGGDLTEPLAGEHLRVPMQERYAAPSVDARAARGERVADVMRDDVGSSQEQDVYEQPPEEMDSEYVNAEHAGYLLDEPEQPQQ